MKKTLHGFLNVNITNKFFLTMPSLEKLKFSKSAIKDGRIQILIQHCHCLVIITKSCQI